jgi:subtilisin family serine protease
VLIYDAPSGTYRLSIERYTGSGAHTFDLITFGQPLEYAVAANSLLHPADNASAGMVSVGAVPWDEPGALEPFSSQGPTTDGRLKPELVAPDRVSNATYGTFTGTSASAPHVAGAAALVKQANTGFTPAQIKTFLQGRAVDLGALGPDTQFGSGRLSLGVSPAVTPTPTPTPKAAPRTASPWAWGNNSWGTLGDGTRAGDPNCIGGPCRVYPVPVSGLSGVRALAGGWNHSVALKTDGTVWASGSNVFGELGTTATVADCDSSYYVEVPCSAIPVPVSRLARVTAIAARGSYSMALRDDGTVWAWGRNVENELGDGHSVYTTDRGWTTQSPKPSGVPDPAPDNPVPAQVYQRHRAIGRWDVRQRPPHARAGRWPQRGDRHRGGCGLQPGAQGRRHRLGLGNEQGGPARGWHHE